MLASRRQRLPVITPTAASTRPRRGASASTATKTIEKHKLEDNEDYVAETAEYTAPAKKKSKQGRARNGATVTPSNSLPDSLSNSNGTPQNINEPRPIQFWLMKAEPEERFEKGVDVSYSIDALAAAKSPEPWEGVFEAYIYSTQHHQLMYCRCAQLYWLVYSRIVIQISPLANKILQRGIT